MGLGRFSLILYTDWPSADYIVFNEQNLARFKQIRAQNQNTFLLHTMFGNSEFVFQQMWKWTEKAGQAGSVDGSDASGKDVLFKALGMIADYSFDPEHQYNREFCQQLAARVPV